MKYVTKIPIKAMYSLLIASLTVTHSVSASEKQADIDYMPYVKSVQYRIKRHWSPKHFPNNLRSIVKFKIHRNGSLSDLKTEKSSGNLSIDQSALSAVQESAPFDPLPAGSPDDDIDIQFTFDYNVFLDIEKNRSKRMQEFEKALARSEALFGPEHETVAVAVRELAEEVARQGYYVRAEPLYQRAITIQKKHLPANERELAITITKFGELYYLQKKYSEAESLYKEAIAINGTRIICSCKKTSSTTQNCCMSPIASAKQTYSMIDSKKCVTGNKQVINLASKLAER